MRLSNTGKLEEAFDVTPMHVGSGGLWCVLHFSSSVDLEHEEVTKETGKSKA